jgi:uncharacterized protein YwgA
MDIDIRDKRTLKEKIIDKLLLLHILSKYNIGRTKLQKTVFFAEDSMNEKGIKSFNYHFFRYHYGEFSLELQVDYNQLEKNGLIAENRKLEITEEGKEVLQAASGLLAKNKQIIDTIDSIAQWASENSLERVKTVAYDRIERKGRTVRNLPQGFPILNKLDEQQAKLKFNLDDSWVETVDTLLNPKEASSLKEAFTQKANKSFEV